VTEPARALDRGEVVRRLEDVAHHLDIRGNDLAPAVLAGIAAADHRTPRVHRRRALRPVTVALVALAVVVATTLVLPAPREALARWLGLDGVRITERDDVPEGLGRALHLGQPVDLSEAADLSDGLALVPRGVGDPAGAYAGRPEGAVTLAWAPSSRLPDVGGTGVGLVISVFPGSTDRAVVEKQLPPGAPAEDVTVDGDPGFWISGPHVVIYFDAAGRPQPDAARLAGNTLLWQHGGVVYRLESALDREAAVALAESLEPL
jgi:hypothetical protein